MATRAAEITVREPCGGDYQFRGQCRPIRIIRNPVIPAPEVTDGYLIIGGAIMQWYLSLDIGWS